ncbi:matrixin family metalloprotease [Acinetobacter sp. NCu2D-2]|uniref:matrixin family metalloprotease n=1 Tax=Acinetobacter sp. NCu2D-2 TaxID=1608473 RepID=UPI0012FF49F9|nr:matrixin family metalloprotease [Acinetobacter sp. NCu2D-2]
MQNYQNPQQRHTAWSDRLSQPFDSRVRFRIGDIDPRFGLTEQQLIQLSQEAIQIWHQGTAKELFVYDPKASLTINLIYDQRQIEHQALKQSQQQLDNIQSQNQQNSQQLDQRYQYLQQRQHTLQTERDELSAEFNRLNQERQSWSRIENQDGVNRQRIEQQYQTLKAKAEQLDADIADLRAQNDEYNRQVDQHNQNIESYNVNVTHFNQRFAAREFHKGIYNGKSIQIYQFDALDDLRLTIAHELGHALGLGHNHDPEALMYPILSAQNDKHFQLKPADISMLNTLK